MKIKDLMTLFFVASLLFGSCTKEPMIDPNPHFTTSGLAEDKVIGIGETFYVKSKKGSAQFRTLFTGAIGQIYGDLASQGTDFGNADSLSVSYGKVGTYTLVLVASSSGDLSEKYKSIADSIIVTVVDKRVTFGTFYLDASVKGKEIKGEIQELLKKISGIVIDLSGITYNKFKPQFTTTSPNAKVYLGEVAEANLQIAGKTIVDFSSADVTPLKYIVVAPHGETSTYDVTLIKKAPLNECELFYIQSLNAKNVPLDLAQPEGDVINFIGTQPLVNQKCKLNVNVSPEAIVALKINDKWEDLKATTQYLIATIQAVRVTAQNQVNTREYIFNYTYTGE